MEIGEVSKEVGERLHYEVPMLDLEVGRRANLTKIVATVIEVLADHGFVEIELVPAADDPPKPARS